MTKFLPSPPRKPAVVSHATAGFFFAPRSARRPASGGHRSNSASYGYDFNGATTETQRATSHVIYHYDLRGKLTGVDTNADGTNDITYTYDALGNRVAMVQNGTTTYYLMDANNPTGYTQVIEEKLNAVDATPAVAYILGQDVIGQLAGSVLSYLLYDGHGSTRALTNANGSTISQTYRYDAYGNLLGNPGTLLTHLLYTGEYFQAELGQYYLRARYYDPTDAQFMQMDTYCGSNLDPRTLNKRAYAVYNPVNMADPTGESPSLATRLGTPVHSFLNRAFEGFTPAIKTALGVSVGFPPPPRLPAGPGTDASYPGVQRWSNRYIRTLARAYGFASANRRRADFVEVRGTTEGDLYELKPISPATWIADTIDMATTLADYYWQLNTAMPGILWNPGSSWLPGVTVWPSFHDPRMPAGSVLITFSDYADWRGAIFYSIVSARDVGEIAAAAAAGIAAEVALISALSGTAAAAAAAVTAAPTIEAATTVTIAAAEGTILLEETVLAGSVAGRLAA